MDSSKHFRTKSNKFKVLASFFKAIIAQRKVKLGFQSTLVSVTSLANKHPAELISEFHWKYKQKTVSKYTLRARSAKDIELRWLN